MSLGTAAVKLHGGINCTTTLGTASCALAHCKSEPAGLQGEEGYTPTALNVGVAVHCTGKVALLQGG